MVGSAREDRAGCFEAVEVGHADVHQDDVGRSCGGGRSPRAPSPASATTSRSGSRVEIKRKPSRTNAWSSAIRMRIICCRFERRHATTR